MSQFRDTFTKEEKSNNLLDYDDSAFRYFAGCLMLCVLIPLSVSVFKRLFLSNLQDLRKSYPSKSSSVTTFKYCQCSVCVTNIENQIKEENRCSKRLRLSTILLLILTCALWYSFIRLCASLGDTQTIQQFNPFSILDISSSATPREIKKAYRLMSLKFHPDKNTNDPTAAAKFMLVNKAYEALTDPVAKANYEKYGNPDGPGVMKIGIGLPRFLVEEEYQLAILCLFFIFLLILIPMGFICYYQRQKKYAPNGVQIETLHFMSYYMSESTRLKNCPEFLAASAESRELPLRESDDMEMKKLIEEVVEPKKRQFNMPIIVRNYFLILCHMQRQHHLLSPLLQEDLNKLLKASLIITNSMMEIATLRDWSLTAQAVVEFRRCLIQALDIRSSSLLQIPHFDEEVLKHCHRGKNAVKDLGEFIAQPLEDRKGLSRMNQQQLADVQAFCLHISNVTIKAEIVVEDENEMVVGDVATCNITMIRNNIREEESVGPVHAPYFPQVKYEEWWFKLSDKHDGQTLGFVRSKSLGREVTESMQFQVLRRGRQIAILNAMCDSYAGCDKTIEIEYKVFSDLEVKREVYVHPEDANLDNEPTLFQQMLGELAVSNVSDEDDDDSVIEKPLSEKANVNTVKKSEQTSKKTNDESRNLNGLPNVINVSDTEVGNIDILSDATESEGSISSDDTLST